MSQYTRYPAIASSSGGSGTIIPNNGTLTGIYSGDVLVTGDASLSADTIVNGDLFVEGNLFDSGGFNLTVTGDCFMGGGFNWNTSPSSIPIGNLTIGGDLTTDFLSTAVPHSETVSNATQVTTRTSNTVFTVNPATNMTGLAAGSTITWTSGLNNGQSRTVLTVSGVTVTLSSATSSNIAVADHFTYTSKSGFVFTGSPTPPGGTVITWTSGLNFPGTATINVSLGQHATLSPAATNFIHPADTYTFSTLAVGLSQMQPSAANGGVLTVGGNYSSQGLLGDSLIPGVDALSLTVKQSLTGVDNHASQEFSANGAPADGVNPASSGGNWVVFTGIRACGVFLNGGATNSNGDGGLGGSFTSYAHIDNANVQAVGGSAISPATGAGGAGGSIQLFGGGTAALDVSGGNSDLGAGGSSGSISIVGGLDSSGVTLNDGSGTAATATASLSLSGSCNITAINMTNRANLVIKPQTAASTFPAPILSGTTIAPKATLAKEDGSTDTFAVPTNYSTAILKYDYTNNTWVTIS